MASKTALKRAEIIFIIGYFITKRELKFFQFIQTFNFYDLSKTK